MSASSDRAEPLDVEEVLAHDSRYTDFPPNRRDVALSTQDMYIHIHACAHIHIPYTYTRARTRMHAQTIRYTHNPIHRHTNEVGI